MAARGGRRGGRAAAASSSSACCACPFNEFIAEGLAARADALAAKADANPNIVMMYRKVTRTGTHTLSSPAVVHRVTGDHVRQEVADPVADRRRRQEAEVRRRAHLQRGSTREGPRSPVPRP